MNDNLLSYSCYNESTLNHTIKTCTLLHNWATVPKIFTISTMSMRFQRDTPTNKIGRWALHLHVTIRILKLPLFSNPKFSWVWLTPHRVKSIISCHIMVWPLRTVARKSSPVPHELPCLFLINRRGRPKEDVTWERYINLWQSEGLTDKYFKDHPSNEDDVM